MQTLEQWLSVATRGLCESAAECVRAEIREHYLCAVESAGTADVDLPEAERRPLHALGDAKTANRQYRRVLLTEGEDVLLRGLTSWKQRLWTGVVALLSALALVLIPVSTLGYVKYLLAMTVIDAALQVIPIGSIRAAWIVRSMRWGVLAIGLAMTFVGASGDSLMYVPGGVLCVISVVHMEFRLFVLRRKVPVDHWPSRLWV